MLLSHIHQRNPNCVSSWLQSQLCLQKSTKVCPVSHSKVDLQHKISETSARVFSLRVLCRVTGTSSWCATQFQCFIVLCDPVDTFPDFHGVSVFFAPPILVGVAFLFESYRAWACFDCFARSFSISRTSCKSWPSQTHRESEMPFSKPRVPGYPDGYGRQIICRMVKWHKNHAYHIEESHIVQSRPRMQVVICNMFD